MRVLLLHSIDHRLCISVFYCSVVCGTCLTEVARQRRTEQKANMLDKERALNFNMSNVKQRKHSAEELNSSVQGIFTLLYLVM